MATDVVRANPLTRETAEEGKDQDQLSPIFVQRCHAVARIIGIIVAAVGVMVLLGWFFGIEVFKSLSPNFVAMKANTAVCLLLSGSAVALLRTNRELIRNNGLVRVFGLVVFGIGFATATEYIFGWDLGIDQVLVKELEGTIGTSSPGRMALSSTLCFMVVGVSLMFAYQGSKRSLQSAQRLALPLVLMGVLSLTGYVYGVSEFQGVINWTPMAVHTAGSFLLLGISICLATPTHGFMQVISSAGGGGAVARRLLPLVIALPPLLGIMRMAGARAELFPNAFGISLKDSVIIVVLAAVIWGTAKPLNSVDEERRALVQQREQAMSELQAAHTKLEAVNDDLARASEEAKSASTAKSEFLSRMSHELRTPLNAILGFGQLLSMEELAPAHQDHVSEIDRAGRHLFQLTNEVLDITHIESGKLAVSLEPVSVNQVLAESLSLVGPLAAARGIDLVRVPERESFCVFADRQRLRQVILNLLSNAVKYNRVGGRVVVTSEPSAQGTVRISVADTGRGIASKDVRTVFEPFERLGAETTNVEGTGLGLAVSKALCGAMRGTLSVDSRSGSGSTFTVELPTADDPSEAPLPVPPTVPTGANASSARGTVLYIEDNLPNIKLMERIFQRHSYLRLVTAKDGASGLRLLKQQRPDLVMLDLHLPDLGGEQVLAKIKADATIAGTPVVIVSADATGEQFDRAMAAGAEDFITKPIDLSRLFEVLDTVLGAEVAS